MFKNKLILQNTSTTHTVYISCLGDYLWPVLNGVIVVPYTIKRLMYSEKKKPLLDAIGSIESLLPVK